MNFEQSGERYIAEYRDETLIIGSKKSGRPFVCVSGYFFHPSSFPHFNTIDEVKFYLENDPDVIF